MSQLESLTLRAPAKLNLYLAVLGKRADGYHEIASLMQMVGLYDHLQFQSRPSGIRLTMEGADLPAGRENLVFRAASLLRREARRHGCEVGGAAIHLVKKIPIAAGLGGGSADAAATLAGLNRLWGLKWPRERLAALGATLGSDVPFFFHGPTAWVTGRGETVQRIQIPALPAPTAMEVWNAWILLVDPGIPISTAWVYAQYAQNMAARENPRSSRPPTPYSLDVERIARLVRRPHNDLEKVTLPAYPALTRIKKQLRRMGGTSPRMSGSGASLFAIFFQKDQALRAASEIREQGLGRAWVVRALRRAPF
jgi:4-diphosphocytidyl-2-C-methyl-D-erythritol kinase